MADLLAGLTTKRRFDPRTQTTLVRWFKILNARGASDRIPNFDIRTLTRIHDMCPPVYVCALALLDANVPEDPAVIRNTQQFATLIDSLGLQSSAKTRDVKNSHKASLVLLELFTYMVMIHRARNIEEEDVAARRNASSQLYEQEFTA